MVGGKKGTAGGHSMDSVTKRELIELHPFLIQLHPFFIQLHPPLFCQCSKLLPRYLVFNIAIIQIYIPFQSLAFRLLSQLHFEKIELYTQIGRRQIERDCGPVIKK